MAKVTWKNYILIGIFSLLAILAGVPKLLGLSFMVESMARIGYAQWFTHILGLLWVLAAIGVWLKKWRIWAVLGSIPIIAGAIAAHISAGDPFPYFILVHVAVILGLLLQEGFFKKL